MSTLNYRFAYQRHLPHYQPSGATLFVTFRLAGSLPAEVLMRWAEEAKRREAALARITDPQERTRQAYALERRLFGKWDEVLDASRTGPFHLRQRQIAELVCESLRHRDHKVYNLDAFCVMPNHVHLVFKPLSRNDGTFYPLSTIMHSLKRHTARQANEALGRQGAFWQHESYDHVVRDETEWRRIVAYVLNNPVKAGLVKRAEEWKWSYCKNQ